MQHILIRDTNKFFANQSFEHFYIAGNYIVKPSFNRISHVSPSISLLTQTDQLNSANFCNDTTLPLECFEKDYCNCVHRIKVELNSVVELTIIDTSDNNVDVDHPFHLHGFPLFVTEVCQNTDQGPMTVEKVRKLRRKNRHIEKNNRHFPIKDTISVPRQGYIVLRFKADNPGFWFGHCHYSFHTAMGMTFILQVGEPHQMARPPPNFPKCGNYMSNDLVPKLKPRWIKVNRTSVLPANCHVGGVEFSQITYVGRKACANNGIALGKVYLNSRRICGELKPIIEFNVSYKSIRAHFCHFQCQERNAPTSLKFIAVAEPNGFHQQMI